MRAMSAGTILNTDILRETIKSVQEDEQKAISALCEILDSVDRSSKTKYLKEVSKVMRKWRECYPAAIAEVSPHLEVLPLACPLFVPLVEEGRGCDDPIVRLTVETYLAPLRSGRVGVVVLGCTHYPLLREAIADFLGPDVQIVGSGRETSLAVRRYLDDQAGLCALGGKGSICCYVSDNPARLRQVGSRFLNENIENVELVTPERYVASAMLQSEVR